MKDERREVAQIIPHLFNKSHAKPNWTTNKKMAPRHPGLWLADMYPDAKRWLTTDSDNNNLIDM